MGEHIGIILNKRVWVISTPPPKFALLLFYVIVVRVLVLGFGGATSSF